MIQNILGLESISIKKKHFRFIRTEFQIASPSDSMTNSHFLRLGECLNRLIVI